VELATAGVVGRAASFESEAMFVYEQIRAIDLQLRTGIPYSVGEQLVTRFPTSRDEPRLGTKKPAKKVVKKTAAPSLDDLDGEMMLDDVGFVSEEQRAKARKEDKLLNEQILKELKHIHERLNRVHGVILAWDRNKSTTGVAYQTGDIPTDDPDFGPWSRADPLPTTTNLVNILPNTFNVEGPQCWPYIDKWRVTGPVPVMALDTHCPGLPDVFADPETLLLVRTNRFEWSRYKKYYGTGRTPWVLQPCDPRNGFVEAPPFTGSEQWGPSPGMSHGGLFAYAELKSPRDVTTWAAFVFPSRGAVWVNDELAWSSGFNEDLINWFMPHRFKVALKKGVNRIAIRADIYDQYHRLGFGMRICVQGKPRSARQVAADKALREKAYQGTKPPCGMMNGGEAANARLFPDSRPPVAWDVENNVNIAWRTSLPWSRGGIIAVKDKLFTTWDPFHLVCLDKNDGKILWMRHLDAVKVTHPDIWEQEKAYLDKFDAMDLKKKLTPDETQRRKELETQRKKFLDKHKAKSTAVSRKHGRGSGLTFANPVSDGRHVYLKVPSGADVVVGCFDLDGNEKWMKVFENAKGGYGGLVPAPVLVGDKLVMMMARYLKGAKAIKEACGGEAPPKGAEYASPNRYSLVALDKATGGILWESPAYPGRKWKFDAGNIAQPIPLRLTNGRGTMDVVIQSSAGAVVRLEDGKELLRYCGALAWKTTPVDNGRGSVWFPSKQLARVDFAMVDRDHVYGRLVFRRERLFEGKGPIQVRDLLFLGDRISHFESYWKTHDAETGLSTGRHTQEFFPMGTEPLHYMPSIRAGGSVVYVATTKETDWAPNGSMMSILAGKPPVILARNWMEGLSSQPVCEGERMYCRASAEIMCLGYTGDSGKQYEAEEVVRTLMSQIPPTLSQNDMEPVQLPDRSRAVSSEHGMFRRQAPEIVRTGLPVHSWKITDPLPPEEAGWVQEFLLRLTTEPAKHGWLYGQRGIVKEGKARVPEEGLDHKTLQVVITGVGGKPSRVLNDEEQYGIRYRLKRVHKGKAGTVCFWHAAIGFDREMTVRLNLGRTRNIQAWIDGMEVKDGQRVHGAFGKHHLLLRTEVAGEAELGDTVRPVLSYAPSREYEETHRKRLLDAVGPLLEEKAKHVNDPQLKEWVAAALRR
jgi:hypothetical protein